MTTPGWGQGLALLTAVPPSVGTGIGLLNDSWHFLALSRPVQQRPLLGEGELGETYLSSQGRGRALALGSSIQRRGLLPGLTAVA